MTTSSDFIQLKVKNDWGVDLFFMPEDSNERHTIDKSAALIFKKGQKVTIQWPNGEVQKVKLKILDIERSIGDMGHNYDVKSSMPAFEVTVNGLSLNVRLIDVLIQRSDCKKANPNG